MALSAHKTAPQNSIQTMRFYPFVFTGERRLKLTGDNRLLDVNADFMATYTVLNEPTLYPSAYLVLTSKGYTKHYYAGTDLCASREQSQACLSYAETKQSVRSNRVAASLGGGGLKAVGSNPGMKERADWLFWESHERVNGRMLQENDHECIWQGSLFTQEYYESIKDIPGRMNASVEFYLNDLYDNLKMLAEEQHDEKDVYFYHSDHLGSAAYLTNHGHVIQTLNYLPYGEDWVEFNYFDPNDTTRLGIYRFNGKEKDYESGFHYYGARYHWAELPTGWLSVDPQTDDLPSVSPYSYCNDNPVVLKDPDGEFPILQVAGAVIGAAYRAGVAISEGKSTREVVGAAVKGAVEGVVLTTPGAGLLVGTALNAAGDAAEQLIGTGSVSVKKVAVNAATNVAFSGAGSVVQKGVSKVAAKATQKVEQKYASDATQKAIRKEVQAEVKGQGKKLGHATKTQVNKTTAKRVQNLKTFDKKVVKAKETVTNVAVDVAANAAASRTANKINGK